MIVRAKVNTDDYECFLTHLGDTSHNNVPSRRSRHDFDVLKLLIPPHGDARTGETLYTKLRSLDGLATPLDGLRNHYAIRTLSMVSHNLRCTKSADRTMLRQQSCQ
jgi:hypothetical protein